MSKSNTFENDLLLLIFNNTDIANVGDAGGLRGSATAGSLYWSLHTSDPGEAGTAITNETAYTSYARQGLTRNGTNFVVTGDTVNPGANVDFPACTASPGGAITHFGIVSTASGAGKLLYKGAFGTSITMNVGTIPRIGTGTAITED